MAFKVLIPQVISQVGVDYLEANGCVVDMNCGTDEAEMIRHGQDCDAMIARTEKVSGAFLRACPNLKAIGRLGVGVNNLDLETAKELGIRVTITPGANSNTVAEHAMSLMCALSKNILFFDRELRKGEAGFAQRNKHLVSDLEGKTLGIIGCGQIGRLLAKKAAFGFGMKVYGYDPYVPADKFEDYIGYMATMEELLRTCDYVSLHMPATPETYRMIGAEQFAMMKPSAYFINVARGEVVDSAALAAALDNDVIAGAGIDVFDPEPPTVECPLFHCKNCIVTPHNAALSHEAMARMALAAATDVLSILNGEEPKWPLKF